MYRNAAMDMTTIELTGEAKPGEGIVGRIISFNEKDARQLSPDALNKKAKELASAAETAQEIPKWMGGMIGEARKNIPDLNRASAANILRAYATDFDHAANTVEARKVGKYLSFTHEDGASERGIVKVVNSQQVREGLWLGYDQEHRLRQIASFKEGMIEGAVHNLRENGSLESMMYYKNGIPHGNARQYNEQGETIHRTEYQDGNVVKAEVVDPVMEKTKRDAKQAEFKVMNSFKVGR